MLPKRTIDGYLTGLNRGHGLSVDPINNEVAATSDLASAVYVFSRLANGNVAPLRKIQGDRTQLLYPEDIVLDPVNGEIVVNNPGDKSILFFSRNASGNVPPLRVIKGPATGIVVTFGGCLNTDTGEYWTLNGPPFFARPETAEYDKQNSPAILVFSRLSNGNVASVRRIYGDKTGLGNPRFCALDTRNNEIYVTNFATEAGKNVHSPSTLEGFVTVYDIRLSGNVAPKRVLRANVFKVSSGIFVSPEHDEIGIVEARENMIMIFPRLW